MRNPPLWLEGQPQLRPHPLPHWRCSHLMYRVSSGDPPPPLSVGRGLTGEGVARRAGGGLRRGGWGEQRVLAVLGPGSVRTSPHPTRSRGTANEGERCAVIRASPSRSLSHSLTHSISLSLSTFTLTFKNTRRQHCLHPYCISRLPVCNG